jgi:hypothetical protein
MDIKSPGLGQSGSAGRPGISLPRAGAAIFLLLALILCACPSRKEPEHTSVEIEARRWPQAEEAFRHDRFWLGGDGAYSVVLGQDRVLWLFGDSFIGDGKTRDRRRALIVRNSVAIQKGLDPSAATVRFSWGTRGGKPDAFFPNPGKNWYWPGSGILIEGRLLLFLMEIAPSQGGLGFEPRGWGAVLIPNPRSNPPAWRVARLKVPGNPFGVIVGSACCLTEGGYLYVFGADSRSHGAYLVRWPVADAARGDLKAPEWLAKGKGWVAQDRLAGIPAPLFRDAQMEFTVHYEPSLKRYVEVQTGSFTDHCLVFRLSDSLVGAWPDGSRFFCPGGTQGLLVYAGKAHPGLGGGDLVCTMAMSSLDPGRLLDEDGLYYPVFVRGAYRAQGR